VLFGLVYLGDLDEANLFKNDTKFLNFRHLTQHTFQDQQKQATSSGGGNLINLATYLALSIQFDI
jgi:hypothetical protein